MSLVPGARFGPYEILTLIGTGGMGEVYRAHDKRLERHVALKVLPAAFADSQARLARFEREARTAGRLNHPNIVATYDVGTASGLPYIVSELLDGETLRQRLRQEPLPTRKVLELSLQLAHGLAAAHDGGVVHRDLKPENIFLTRDGRLKILDFGLATAKLDLVAAGSTATVTADTAPGVILGTAGYMAPEQVRGEAATPRSDIFAFGAVLYEMLTGQRAFDGSTTVEAMTAILNADPPDPSPGRAVPAVLDRIVRRCLEKRPDERFQSARDVAFALDALSGLSTPSLDIGVSPSRGRSPASSRLLLIVPLIFALAVAAYAGWSLRPQPEVLSFRQLTFRRGTIDAARFTPDGSRVIYSAAWEGGLHQAYAVTVDNPEPQPVSVPAGNIVKSVSPAGLLLLRGDMLAVAPLLGGTPRELAARTTGADADARTGAIAAIRSNLPKPDTLEYQLGTPIYQASAATPFLWLARISRDGSRVALVEFADPSMQRGRIIVVKADRAVETWLAEPTQVSSIVWSPDDRELWFTTMGPGISELLMGVNARGEPRVIARFPGRFTIADVSTDGRALMIRHVPRRSVRALGSGASSERDLSWFSQTALAGLASDGTQVLLSESGHDTAEHARVYLRSIDGGAAVHLGGGAAIDLSPDGAWALTRPALARTSLVLLPTGAGEARTLPLGDLDLHDALWFPDSVHLLVLQRASPRASQRAHMMDTRTGHLRALSDDQVSFPAAIAPDGTRVAITGHERRVWIYAASTPSASDRAGIAARAIDGLPPLWQAIQWSEDGGSLFVTNPVEAPNQIFRFVFATRRLTPVAKLNPGDPAVAFRVRITRDGRSYAYGWFFRESELHLTSGLR